MKKLFIALVTICSCIPVFSQGITITESSKRIRLTVWSNTNQYGNPKVYVGGNYMGRITSFYNSTPSVNAYGCVSFDYTVHNDGTRPAVIRIESDNGYIWHHESEIHYKDRMNGTLRVYCRGEKEKSRSTSNYSSGRSSGGGYYSSGSSSSDYSNSSRGTDDALAELGAAAVLTGVVFVAYLAAESDWDTYKSRLDIDPIWGSKLGTWGVSLSWRSPSFFGLTAGIGKETKQRYGYESCLLHWYGGYDTIELIPKRLTKTRWMAGMQFWLVNGINLELGVGSMYHKKLNDVKTSWYAMTNFEVHLFNGVGLYTGAGVGKSFKGSAPVKFLWDVGLRLRLGAF